MDKKLGHNYHRVQGDRDDQGYPRWRWLCACGGVGRWNYQSDDAAHYAWARHAGVDPTSIELDRP